MGGSRARLAVALAASALAARLAGWLALLAAPAGRAPGVALGAAGAALVAGAAFGGWDRPARLGMVALAGAYAAELLQRRAGLAAGAPVFAAVLLACGELSALAAALRGLSLDASLSLRRSLAEILAVAAAGLLAGALVLGLAGALAPRRSLVLALAGSAALAAVSWLLALAARWVR